MASKTVIKNIYPELAEFIGCHTFTEVNEYIEFELNQNARIDDLNVIETAGGISNGYRMSLIYPSSGDEAIIKNGAALPYFLNENEGGTGKLWYRVPARTKFRVTCTTHTATETISITMLAQSS